MDGSPVWTERASAVPQVALALGVGIAGALLVALARGNPSPDGRAALWLGLGLLVVAVAALLTAGSETTRIDPRSRTITVTRRGLLRPSVRVIGLDQVVGVDLDYLGRASSGVQFYSLRLDLAGGRHDVLFGPGRFYPGGSSRAVAEERRRHLLELVGRG